MKKNRRVLAMSLAFAMMTGLLAGCGNSNGSAAGNQAAAPAESAAEETQAPQEVVEGIIEGEAAAEQVDRVVVQTSATSEDPSPFAPLVGGNVKDMLYGKLIERDAYGALLEDCTMWLAKSVTKVDDYTYEIELNDNIMDSKGNNITADDVIFSYQMSYELGKFMRVGSSMESLDKTDDYHLTMKLSTCAPGTIEDLLSNPQLNIVDKEWYEGASDDERRHDPATTGAYRVVSEVAGSSIVLEAVEDYWMKDMENLPMSALQNVKTIEYKVIAEPSMIAIALENKEVDIAFLNDATNLSRFYSAGQAADGYNVRLGIGIYTVDMFMNMSENSVLSKSKELRKAVAYALNSEDIMYAAGNDENTSFVLKTLGTSYMAGAQDSWESEDYYDYDPAVAASYLEEAGYKPGEVTLRFLSSPITCNDAARAVILANLEEAGFNVELVTVDMALLNTYRADATQWDLVYDFRGTGTGHIAGLWDGAFNPAGYADGTSICFNKDEELVGLLEAANSEPTDANMDAFHQYLKEQTYVKGLYSLRGAQIASNSVLEIATNSLGNLMPNACVFSADYVSVAK